jgi:hypothetical protein
MSDDNVIKAKFGEETAVEAVAEILQEFKPDDVIAFVIKDDQPVFITTTYDELSLYRARECLSELISMGMAVHMMDDD